MNREDEVRIQLTATATTACVKYREVNYKYRLAVDFFCETPIQPPERVWVGDFVELWPSGLLVIAYDYMWDGPSGPTWDSRCAMRASLVHDALYQLMREGGLPHDYRKEADAVFYQLLKRDGMPWWRRLLWWRAVRRFAAYAIKPRFDQVESAPWDPQK